MIPASKYDSIQDQTNKFRCVQQGPWAQVFMAAVLLGVTILLSVLVAYPEVFGVQSDSNGRHATTALAVLFGVLFCCVCCGMEIVCEQKVAWQRYPCPLPASVSPFEAKSEVKAIARAQS